MKSLIITIFSFFVIVTAGAQASRTDVLNDLEKNASATQELKLTATTRSSTRLFREKDDLTTVILIIPKGTPVDVIGSDTTYFHVLFEEYDGYILRRHAILNEPAVVSEPVVRRSEPVAQESNPVVQQNSRQSRFTYLENKYGTAIAAKLSSGKIWKGMNSEMITDSWGKPPRINRVISGNIVKEEWIYTNSWLYLEDDVLIEWGPVRK